MLDLLQDPFYWTGMAKNAELHIAKCEQCSKFKSRPQWAQVENIQAIYLLQLVHLHYMTIKTTEGGKDVHILIIMDHFTRHTQALVTSPQTAKCMAQALWDQFWFTLVCLNVYSLIRATILKVTSLQNCVNWQKSKSCISVHTIHR